MLFYVILSVPLVYRSCVCCHGNQWKATFWSNRKCCLAGQMESIVPWCCLTWGEGNRASWQDVTGICSLSTLLAPWQDSCTSSDRNTVLTYDYDRYTGIVINKTPLQNAILTNLRILTNKVQSLCRKNMSNISHSGWIDLTLTVPVATF